MLVEMVATAMVPGKVRPSAGTWTFQAASERGGTVASDGSCLGFPESNYGNVTMAADVKWAGQSMAARTRCVALQMDRKRSTVIGLMHLSSCELALLGETLHARQRGCRAWPAVS